MTRATLRLWLRDPLLHEIYREIRDQVYEQASRRIRQGASWSPGRPLPS